MTIEPSTDELRARIRQQYGDGIPVRSYREPGAPAPVDSSAGKRGRSGESRPEIRWPVRLTLPWSTLVSDNEKHVAKLRGQQPIMAIKRHYAEAEARIHALAQSKCDGAPAAQPLALVARVWMPDERVHDLTNSCKLVHDALEGAVYENDRWLHDVRWLRAGVDVDAPRAELTITPLLHG